MAKDAFGFASFLERCGICCNGCSKDKRGSDVVHAEKHSFGDEQNTANAYVLDGAIWQGSALTTNASSHDNTGCYELEEKEIEDGMTYKGQWLGEKFHGIGALKSKDGLYTGHFTFGKAHGDGTFIAQNGNVYEGHWEEDRAHGFGKYEHADHSVYQGEFRRRTLPSSSHRLLGFNCLFHGTMISSTRLVFTNTLEIEGQFEKDKMHGDGMYAFEDGRVYNGQWTNGHMHGQGVLKWQDGSSYTGTMMQDARSGEGTLIWPDGRSYRGQWLNGKPAGKGVYTSAKGVEDQGIWKNGMLVSSCGTDEKAGPS